MSIDSQVANTSTNPQSSTAQRVPPDYMELFSKTWRKNRVHNSDEFSEVIEDIAAFCRKKLRGEVRIHDFTPGETYNYWRIPQRWNLKKFHLIDPNGKVLLDEKAHPLVVGCYSDSVDTEISLDDLKTHIVTREDLPEAYSFYFRQMYRHWESGWKICMPHNLFKTLKPGTYKVKIEAERNNKPMPVFEYILKGESEETIFMAGHLDHPGQVNDSLAGSYACLQVIDALEKSYEKTRFTYRILLVPEIIGTAAYLKRFENEIIPKTLFSFCPNETAHDAPLAFCRSKGEHSLLDYALRLALKTQVGAKGYVEGAFHRYPDCGDEISFDTVGYQIPSPTISRIAERFPYYHTSMDDFARFSQPEHQKRHQGLVNVMVYALSLLEENMELETDVRGNPCLSNPDLDLYLDASNLNNRKVAQNLRFDFDGRPIDLRNFMEFFLDALNTKNVSILEMAHQANMPFEFVKDYAQKAIQKGFVHGKVCLRRDAIRKVASTSLQLGEV